MNVALNGRKVLSYLNRHHLIQILEEMFWSKRYKMRKKNDIDIQQATKYNHEDNGHKLIRQPPFPPKSMLKSIKR